MHTHNEGHESVQQLQNVVAMEDEQLEKGGSTREVQDLAFLNHDQPASSSVDDHSVEVNYLGCTVVYKGKNLFLDILIHFQPPRSKHSSNCARSSKQQDMLALG